MLLEIGQEIIGNALHLAQLFTQLVILDALQFLLQGIEIVDSLVEKFIIELVQFLITAGKIQLRLGMFLFPAMSPIKHEDAEDDAEGPGQMARSEPVITRNGKADKGDEI